MDLVSYSLDSSMMVKALPTLMVHNIWWPYFLFIHVTRGNMGRFLITVNCEEPGPTYAVCKLSMYLEFPVTRLVGFSRTIEEMTVNWCDLATHRIVSFTAETRSR